MKLLKNIKRNTIILFVLTIGILIFILKDNLQGIVKTLSTMNIWYVIVAVALFFLSVSIKAYIIYKTVDEKEKLSLREAIKHNIITQFFNGITPFSTGGQPMEIYMLTEHNIKTTKATNITIQNFIFYQTALVIYGVLAVIYNAVFHIFPRIPILRRFVLLGFIINTLVVICLFIITFSRSITKKITHFIIRLLSKLNIIRNKDEKIEKWNYRLEEFHDGAQELRKRKKLFLFGVLGNLVSLTCLYSIPLFIAFGLGNFTSLNLADTLTSSAYVLIIGSFVPIPGASGGIEYGFIKFFGNFFSSISLNTMLLVWRFITYYLGIIVGAFLFSLEKKEN